MKILILAAMDKELSLLYQLISKDAPESLHLLSAKGHLGNHEVILAKSGIGKVNAALNCQRLVKVFRPDLVINSGVAGGAGLPVGSLLVADRVTYDDVWCGPGTEYGQADGMPLFMKPSEKVLEVVRNKSPQANFGLICTGDKFISTAEEIAFIRSKFPDVKAVDMESAAVAQTCLLNETEFAIIRVVSDTPGEGENIEQYKNFWTEAPRKTFSMLEMLISNLN